MHRLPSSLRNPVATYTVQLGREFQAFRTIGRRTQRIYELIEAGGHSPQISAPTTTRRALRQMAFSLDRFCRRQFIIKELCQESVRKMATRC